MPDWKRVKVSFPTIKLGQFIEPVKRTVAETSGKDYHTVYGVTNTEGITVTGKMASKDISNYITVDEGCFAYNPYRINVGSIGFNDKGIRGCVSPAYVVFKTRNGFNPEFLFLYLKSDFGNHLINWHGNRGGVRNALRYDNLCEIDVPRIDSKEQMTLLKKIQRTNATVAGFNSGLDAQLSMLKQLRQAVLQEAIEGKLTAEWRKQNSKLISGENHASKLLEKIRDEKDRLISEGKIRKEKTLPPITEDEHPFQMPDGWVWCRLGQIVAHLNGYAFKSEWFKPAGVRLVRNINVSHGHVDWSEEARLPTDKATEYGEYLLNEGDIVISLDRPIISTGLKVARIRRQDMPCLLLQRVLKVEPIFFKSEYLFNWINSSLFVDGINPGRSIGIPHVSHNEIMNLCIPLPPIEEQQAIIERVSKLASIINELEKQVTDRKQQSELLMQSVLREAFVAK